MITSWRWLIADLLLAVTGVWLWTKMAPGTDRLVVGAAAVYFASDFLLNQLLGGPGEIA